MINTKLMIMVVSGGRAEEEKEPQPRKTPLEVDNILAKLVIL